MAIHDDIKQLRDDFVALKAKVITDIQKLHDLLEAGDLPGAQAAIAEIRAGMAEVETEVDRPEPGDEPPAPPA